MIKHIGAGVLAFSLLFAVVSAAAPAEASALTSTQISAIVSLLQSFGADQGVIDSVSAALGGSTTSDVSCGSFANVHYGDFDNDAGGRVSQLQTFLGIPSAAFGFGTYGKKTQAAWNSMCGGRQATPSTTYTPPTTTTNFPTPSISVTYPNGGEQITYNTGKDVDFRPTWTSSSYSNLVYVWLVSTNGSKCLVGSTLVEKGNLPVTLGPNFQCQNGQPVPVSGGQYKIEVGGDDPSGSGKEIGDSSDGYFTLTATQQPPSISYISPTMSTGKDVDRVSIYGSNFLLIGKGGPVYVDLLQNGSIKQHLSPTDSPMTIFAGSYLTPPDSTGSRMEVRVNNASLGAGTYQLQVTTDAGTSNAVNYVVQ